MKKLLSVLLLGAMLLTVFASCGGETPAATAGNDGAETSAADNAEAAVTEAETEATAYSYLERTDYDGYEFRIIAPTGQTRYLPDTVVPEEMTGEIIYDAAYERNAAVEDYFNVKMVYVDGENVNACTTKVSSLVLAGDDAFDLIETTPVQTGILATQKVLLDIDDLPSLDLSQPWYSAKVNDAMTVNGKLKMVCSDYTCIFLSNIYCMFFNQDMAGELQLPDLYEETMNGRWTIDRMTEYCENVNADLDGDGVMTEDDRWAFTVGYGLNATSTNYTALQYGMGQFTTKTAADGSVSIAVNTEREVAILEKLNHLITELPMLATTKNDKNTMATFARSNVLFLTCIIMHAPNYMRDMEATYGVLPLPKFDETQDEYYTTVAQNSGMFEAFPITTADTARTSAIFEALAYEGYQRVVPAFYETSMKVKYSHDEMTSKVFDMLRDSVVMDFGIIFDGTCGMALISAQVLNSKDPGTFASTYAKIEEKAIAQYQSVLDAFN